MPSLPNFQLNNSQNSTKLAKSHKKGVTVDTPVRGDGNTPLRHKIDIAKRLLSKQYSDLTLAGQNTCPINGVSVNLDYFQCTGLIPMNADDFESLGSGLSDFKHLSNLILCINRYLDGGKLINANDTFRNGCWKYQNYYKSNSKVIFAYGFFDDGFRYYLQFPGIPLRMLELSRWQSLISDLFFKYRARFTRIDICVDDYKRRVKATKLVKLAQKGDVGRVLRYHYIESGAIGNPSETTIYFGSGRKQLYFYNAEFLHNIAADRWETRFREERAHMIASAIADFANFPEIKSKNLSKQEILQEMLRYMGSVCLGAVDFIKRSGKTGRSFTEFKRYRFWDSLIADVGGIQHLPIPIVKLDVLKFCKKTFTWLAKGVFKRKACLYFALGEETFANYVDSQIQSGSIRFTDYDLDWINKIKSLFDSLNFTSESQKLDYINQFIAC